LHEAGSNVRAEGPNYRGTTTQHLLQAHLERITVTRMMICIMDQHHHWDSESFKCGRHQ
jgi:hypothetical protein